MNQIVKVSYPFYDIISINYPDGKLKSEIRVRCPPNEKMFYVEFFKSQPSGNPELPEFFKMEFENNSDNHQKAVNRLYEYADLLMVILDNWDFKVALPVFKRLFNAWIN